MSHPSNIGHIVDRQVSLWGLKQGVQVEGRPFVGGALEKPTEGPWITISTRLGAGGLELAARLGERLGWRVIDKEILQEIAKTTHTRERILSHFDDHAVGAFEDYRLRTCSHPATLVRSAYVLQMMRVVWAIARAGERDYDRPRGELAARSALRAARARDRSRRNARRMVQAQAGFVGRRRRPPRGGRQRRTARSSHARSSSRTSTTRWGTTSSSTSERSRSSRSSRL